MKAIGLIKHVCKMAQPLMRPQPDPSHLLQFSNKMTLNGVCHGLKPIVSSEFLIDMVEMVAQGLRTDTERRGDTWSIFSC